MGGGVDQLLSQAAAEAGIGVDGAELIRDGSNTIIGLRGGIVARIGPEGSIRAARRQLAVSRWLRDAGLRVVTAAEGLRQPIVVSGRLV